MLRKRGAGYDVSDTCNCECQICLDRVEEVPEESDPKVDKKAKPPSRVKKMPICCAEFARKLKPKQKRRQGASLNGLMAFERNNLFPDLFSPLKDSFVDDKLIEIQVGWEFFQ